MSESNFFIETKNLWRVYQSGTRQVQALRGISLQLPSSKFIALKGRSGSGKTTLLNCLGGLDKPTEGEIRIGERLISSMNDRDLTHWRAREVGFIFQSFGLIPTFSAFENVEFMLRLAHHSPRERTDRALEVLDMVGIKQWRHHRPYEMSGGQQQRVTIARALANRPLLVLADEATGELDSTTARDILSLFRKIVDNEGVTLLMASHDPLVDGYADIIYQIRDGQIES